MMFCRIRWMLWVVAMKMAVGLLVRYFTELPSTASALNWSVGTTEQVRLVFFWLAWFAAGRPPHNLVEVFENFFFSSSTARPPTQIFAGSTHFQLSWRLRWVVKIMHHFKTIVTRAPWKRSCFHDTMMTYRWQHIYVYIFIYLCLFLLLLLSRYMTVCGFLLQIIYPSIMMKIQLW